MIALLVSLLSGTMFYLSQGLDNVWVLAWVAPAPLLWLAYRRAPKWQIAGASGLAFLCGQAYIVQCYWGELPADLVVPLEAQLVILFATAVVLSGAALRRLPPLVALFAFPAFWSAAEFLIDRYSPHGSYGSLAYAETAFPAGIQIASLLGLYSITFSLCLFANALAFLAHRRWVAGTLGAALCLLGVVYGYTRLGEPPGPRVAVAALADADSWHAENRAHTLQAEVSAAEAYSAAIKAEHGTRVFVIPEGAIRMSEHAQAPVLAPLAAAARSSHAVVVAGTFVPWPTQNRAFAFFPDGRVMTYAKRHPLWPLETEPPGHTSGYLGGGYATQICKDMDFVHTVRTTALRGVRLMIVPANDFGHDGYIHARMSVMEGVENGFAVLRSAFNGLETISDAYGRILASASTMRPGMVVTTAAVPLGPGPTLYTHLGNVFPWLCALASIALGIAIAPFDFTRLIRAVLRSARARVRRGWGR